MKLVLKDSKLVTIKENAFYLDFTLIFVDSNLLSIIKN